MPSLWQNMETHARSQSPPQRPRMDENENENTHDSSIELLDTDAELASLSRSRPIHSSEEILDDISWSQTPDPSARRKPKAQPRVHVSKTPTRPDAGMMTAEGDKLTFKDKKKFFEKEIEEQHAVKPKEDKKFTYLQEHEVAKLKTEEERKVNSMSQDQLTKYIEDNSGIDGNDINKMMASGSRASAVRTLTAEQRLQCQSRRKKDANNVAPGNGQPATAERRFSAEQRALEARKRSASRQARLKSREQDAFEAKPVVNQSPPHSPDGSTALEAEVEGVNPPESQTNGSAQKLKTNGH